MNKLFLYFLTLFFILFSINISYSAKIENTEIDINWVNYNFTQVYKIIDKILDENWKNDFLKKEQAYKKLINKTKKIYQKNNNERVWKLILLFNYSLQETIKKREIYYSKTQKIKIWESELWKDIYAYYKWDPRKWYFTIIWSIHGWYEYWTYNTALYLIDEFEKSRKTWWMIIPTLNPDWLEYYLQSDKKYAAYLKWRVNANNVDLNRNFCTDSFELKEFIKNGYRISTWRNWCNSEKETRVMIEVLRNFKINKVISMHSRWAILFIPDNSFDDDGVIKFWNEIVSLLPWYKFNTNYSNNFEKNQRIKEYEINEWWDADFTWTMETYIYENYGIPTILLELESHWKIEYRLKELTKFLEDL